MSIDLKILCSIFPQYKNTIQGQYAVNDKTKLFYFCNLFLEEKPVEHVNEFLSCY